LPIERTGDISQQLIEIQSNATHHALEEGNDKYCPNADEEETASLYNVDEHEEWIRPEPSRVPSEEPFIVDDPNKVSTFEPTVIPSGTPGRVEHTREPTREPTATPVLIDSPIEDDEPFGKFVSISLSKDEDPSEVLARLKAYEAETDPESEEEIIITDEDEDEKEEHYIFNPFEIMDSEPETSKGLIVDDGGPQNGVEDEEEQVVHELMQPAETPKPVIRNANRRSGPLPTMTRQSIRIKDLPSKNYREDRRIERRAFARAAIN